MEQENSTKQRIRKVALELFNEKSFEDVTLNEICEKSGINKNTFYYHFRSKDEILEHYYNIPLDFKTKQMSTILSADSFVEQFWLMNAPMIDFIELSGVAIVRQIFIKNMCEDKGAFTVSGQKRDIIRMQRRIVEKGQAAGEFRSTADSRFLVMQFVQQIISTAMIWSVHLGKFDFREYLRYSYENIFDVEPSLRTMSEWTVHNWVFMEDDSDSDSRAAAGSKSTAEPKAAAGSKAKVAVDSKAKSKVAVDSKAAALKSSDKSHANTKPKSNAHSSISDS